MTRLCHACAARDGHLGPPPTGSLTGTQYQLDKFLKHAVPPSASRGLVSVFTSGANYSAYIVNTMLSGSVEFDDQGRKNVVWFAGAQTGCVYVSATLAKLTDGVKVVLSDDELRIHAYPTGVQDLRIGKCDKCNGDLV